MIFPGSRRRKRAILEASDAETIARAFTRSAIVFDFGKTGTETTRAGKRDRVLPIGRDLIQQLITLPSARPKLSMTFDNRGSAVT